MNGLNEVCEVCGEPAVSCVQDIREVAPSVDEGPNPFRQWERDGPPHIFCADHDRPGRSSK